MTGKARIKPPSTRDRFYRRWRNVVALIEAGVRPEPGYLAWLLRHGERDSKGHMVPVPRAAQEYLADLIDARHRKRGRPKSPSTQIELEHLRAAIVFLQDIDALTKIDQAAAFAAYEKANNLQPESAKRRYRAALATLRSLDSDAVGWIRKAARTNDSTLRKNAIAILIEELAYIGA
jgi:hypothetical protein